MTALAPLTFKPVVFAFNFVPAWQQLVLTVTLRIFARCLCGFETVLGFTDIPPQKGGGEMHRKVMITSKNERMEV